MIKSVRAGMPAEEAGLLAGDVILAVNGDPVEGKDSADVSSWEIRGVPGVELTLRVRTGTGAIRDVTLRRREWLIEANGLPGCDQLDAGGSFCVRRHGRDGGDQSRGARP